MADGGTGSKTLSDRRVLYTQRWNALVAERSSWFGHWQEISQYVLPRSGRFVTSDRNRGDKKHNNIYDSTGCRAHRTLAAGLMAGMTSPARPWFRLSVSDAKLADVGSVKSWLNAVTKKMQAIFAQSNTYRALHGIYSELGAFGVACNVMLDDFEDVLRFYPMTIGEYCLTMDDRGVINGMYRQFDITVAQCVNWFGLSACSMATQNLYTNGQGLDKWITILHVVEQRTDRDQSSKASKDKKFASIYLEYNINEPQFLRESGFDKFPGVAARWEVTGNDIYGSSPAMEALGDVKQLQQEQLRKSQVIDLKTLPPLQVPTTYKGNEVDTLPGGVTYVDQQNGGGIKSAFEVNLDLDHLLEDIKDVRQRINSSFYADLFMMLINDDRSGVTAREVQEKHEEKLLMLGPVLERLHDELLTPLIDLTFDKMMAAGIVPPPPQELQGQQIKIEFVSVLAQAQKAVGLASLDRLLTTVSAIAPIKPDVVDKLDTDAVVDAYADMLGVDPDLVVPDDQVQQIRAQRAQQQQAAQAAAAAPAAAKTAQSLSQINTDPGNPNALNDVINRFSGYTGTG